MQQTSQLYTVGKPSCFSFFAARDRMLGNRIKEIRLQKKISQTEIAYRCGFDKSNYNTIESGKRNPTIISLLKIAKALDVSLIELLPK